MTNKDKNDSPSICILNDEGQKHCGTPVDATVPTPAKELASSTATQPTSDNGKKSE